MLSLLLGRPFTSVEPLWCANYALGIQFLVSPLSLSLSLKYNLCMYCLSTKIDATEVALVIGSRSGSD